jgi:4-hydroxy-tetrahydrodipicolinate synthase
LTAGRSADSLDRVLPVRFGGIFPPIPTPFTRGGDVDAGAVTANVERWMTTGLSGVLALGSNGEAALLDDDEGDRVVDAARRAVPSERKLLVGTGRESTRATIDATRRAVDRGADAVLVRTPSYFRGQMTADALVAHFTSVADASPVPVLLYNLPGVTGLSLTLQIVSRLAGHSNIAGMKETSPDLERLGQFAGVRPTDFHVLCGWAPVVFPALAAGASGAVLAVANVIPEACVVLYEHATAGRYAEALALQRQLTPLAQLVSSVHGVAGLKAALDLIGFVGGPVRPPLLPASAGAREEIARALEEFRRG